MAVEGVRQLKAVTARDGQREGGKRIAGAQQGHGRLRSVEMPRGGEGLRRVRLLVAERGPDLTAVPKTRQQAADQAIHPARSRAGQPAGSRIAASSPSKSSAQGPHACRWAAMPG